jgi:hypothetical protein
MTTRLAFPIALRTWTRLRLWFDPSKLHLFNPDNGAHLTL